jgi:phage tail sheath protein FI
MGSANVTVNIIDQSQPTQAVASGIPAGIIGTSETGPAFVPVTFTTYGVWKTLFGESGDRFGPLAVSQWLANASQATYLRVLGIGDGNKRSAATGQITNAGFVVGVRQVQDSGVVANNPYASVGGNEGRTHFLGVFMSESAGSTVFSEAGLQADRAAYPIIRGVIMTPSGVSLTLSGNINGSNAPGATSAIRNGGITGSLSITGSMFVMLLNGHTNTTAYPSIVTASLEIGDNHISKKLNTDPLLLEEAGHYLYSYYDVPTSLAVPTGTIVFNAPYTLNDQTKQDVVFITTSSISRNTSTAVIPNFENFSERYTTPRTPYIVSQDFGGTRYPLFRVLSLSDGANANEKYKVLIENITPSRDPAYSFGTFDLAVYTFGTDTLLQRFTGLSLDPSSTSYVARAIGDQHVYFDFDRASSSQKLAIDGDYPVVGNYVRVEISDDVIQGNVPATALPFGFKGYGYLNTSGSILASGSDPGTMDSGHLLDLQRAAIPPVPMRKNINAGGIPSTNIAWGTQLQLQSLSDYNYTEVVNDSVASYTKFFPSFAPSDAKFFVENSSAADAFCNNLFTIENIQVVTASSTYADPSKWSSASYVRQGNIVANAANKTRGLTVDDLSNVTSRTSQYVSFEVIMQGGFDGVNIFDSQKSNLTNLAIKREIDDAGNQGGSTSGPTVVAYKKAVDIMGSKSDTDIQILAIPGIRHSSVTNYAITAIENRFDAMYIMDIEERDAFNAVITGSSSTIDVSYTVSAFEGRNLNTSFAAAYFPDVTITNPDTGDLTSVPPSVAVIGAFAKNDRVGAYWNAPAGFNRASLASVVDSSVSLSQDDLDTLYDASINPLVAFPGTGFVVWGQKTLLQAASSLDRINVRRLLIFLRRQVRQVANSLLFEPNTQATLDRFNSLVNPILQRIQSGGGVDRYKVQIDTTTTTQADIENNTIRGKIFIQPTRTAEFISVDFVVTGRSASV